MAWLAQSWTFIATLIVLFAPGLVAAWSVGLRRLGAWAFAPTGSVAMIGLLAIVYPLVRVPWTPIAVWLGLAVTAGLLAGGRILLRVPVWRIDAIGGRGLVVAGLGGGIALVAVRLIAYIGDPSNVSQSNDAPFHLGAVRAVIELGAASPFGLGGLVDPEAAGSFYPGAWHAVTSVVVWTGRAGIPEATNVLSVVVGAVVWPLGVAWLTQVATGRRLAAAVAAGLSPALLAFPLLLIQYGILYAYLIAVAILPSAVAAVLVVSSTPARAAAGAPGSRRSQRVVALIVSAGMSALAVAIAQPSLLLAGGVVVGSFAVWRVCRAWRGAAPRTRVASLVALVCGFALLAAAWVAMSRLVDAAFWGPVRSTRQAVIDVATGAYAGTHAAFAVSLLALLGIVSTAWMPRLRWLAASWFVFAGLYFVAAVVADPRVRLPLVGPWYSDTYRLAALLPVATIPLAAVGVVVVADAAVAAMRRRRGDAATVRERGPAWSAVAIVLLAGLAGVVQQPLVQRYHVANGVTEERSRFVIADDSWLSLDERALLERMSGEVEAGARVVANPGTGAAFGYALSGVDVYPAKWQLPSNAAFALLGERMADAAADPAVCAAVDELGVGYALDFGLGERGTGRSELPGLTGFDGRAGFELVDSAGDASLWRITACG